MRKLQNLELQFHPFLTPNQLFTLTLTSALAVACAWKYVPSVFLYQIQLENIPLAK